MARRMPISARPFGDGDEHDVHDADARREQGDGTDHRHADAHVAREAVELLDHRVVRRDFKILLLSGPHLADDAHGAARLLEGGVVAGRVARSTRRFKLRHRP